MMLHSLTDSPVVGEPVGAAVVGLAVGSSEGLPVGGDVVWFTLVGFPVGAIVASVGSNVGTEVGADVLVETGSSVSM